MYCKQEPDETLIIIKSEWTRHLQDKVLNNNNNNNKDILTGSPHHKKVVFSGALHKINNKYEKMI